MYEKMQSSRKVGEAFGVGKDQISRIMKRKADVLSEYENNAPNERMVLLINGGVATDSGILI